jgi:hypothetical protein
MTSGDGARRTAAIARDERAPKTNLELYAEKRGKSELSTARFRAEPRKKGRDGGMLRAKQKDGASAQARAFVLTKHQQKQDNAKFCRFSGKLFAASNLCGVHNPMLFGKGRANSSWRCECTHPHGAGKDAR